MVKRKVLPEARPPTVREPDLVDLLVEYVRSEFKSLSASILEEFEHGARERFGGMDKIYIRSNRARMRDRLVRQVLAMFNGRNTHEVARRLHIHPNTVRRIIKQPGGALPPIVSDSPET